MQQIAGSCRLVAELPGGARDNRPGQHAVIPADPRIGGKIGVADKRANAQAALVGWLNPIEADVVDVDKMRGRFDLEFHQIQQIGAASDEF